MFRLTSPFEPTGDQPEAIERIARRFGAGDRFVALQGVTGSGKTFTMANVIERLQRPTLVISHNKTLAAQLYAELKGFFPDNAVEYFVSYYDYYQPEAYIPQTDTYIAKDAAINEAIERLRLSATNSLLMRRDVVIVASVSCIYGLGSPGDYAQMLVEARVGETLDRDDMLKRLVDIQYRRNDYEPSPGVFRVRGDTVDVFPSYSTNGVRLEFFGDEVERISEIDPVSGNTLRTLDRLFISPAKHFVMPIERMVPALDRIARELDARVAELERGNRLVEAQRLAQRTRFDLEMIREIGYCSGIENYSRHLAGREAGEPPDTLLDYFSGEFLTIVDESHVTLPQIRGMYNGDQARKTTLVEHGFRLPSARDNRPLNYDEFLSKTGAMLFSSATPGPIELALSSEIVEQTIRPTGLVDPPVEVRPLGAQIEDLMGEVRRCAEAGERTLVTTLTKRTAEDLAAYFRELGLRVSYLHADIDAIERVDTLNRLRSGEFDCLVGINLLREGLDLPEVALVAILDADKEGFLRSETSLIQIAGRAARHENGRVILYADAVTRSMRRMIDETQRRRERQRAYNAEHGIVPRGVSKALGRSLVAGKPEAADAVAEDTKPYGVEEDIRRLEREMAQAAEALEFERAASLRDALLELRKRHRAED